MAKETFIEELKRRSLVTHQKSVLVSKKKIQSELEKEQAQKELERIKIEKEAEKFVENAKKRIRKAADKGDNYCNILDVGNNWMTPFNVLVKKGFEKLGLNVSIRPVEGSAEGSGAENDYIYMIVYWTN